MSKLFAYMDEKEQLLYNSNLIEGKSRIVPQIKESYNINELYNNWKCKWKKYNNKILQHNTKLQFKGANTSRRSHTELEVAVIDEMTERREALKRERDNPICWLRIWLAGWCSRIRGKVMLWILNAVMTFKREQSNGSPKCKCIRYKYPPRDGYAIPLSCWLKPLRKGGMYVNPAGIV